jgi:hypothetical protein
MAAPLQETVQDLIAEYSPTEILEALAKECAYWARKEPRDAPRWKRARAMLLKTAAVTRDVGM